MGKTCKIDECYAVKMDRIMRERYKELKQEENNVSLKTFVSVVCGLGIYYLVMGYWVIVYLFMVAGG